MPSPSSRRLNRAYDAARHGQLLARVHDRIRRHPDGDAVRPRQLTPAASRSRRSGSVPDPFHARSSSYPMRFARITGTGSYPAGRTPEQPGPGRPACGEAASRLPTSWIVERTGIRARHFAVRLSRTRVTSLSRRPAMRCRPPAGKVPADIDLIIVATSTPDMVFPSTACIVQRKLGIQGSPGLRRPGRVLGFRLRA